MAKSHGADPHRHAVLERDALQGIAVCYSMLDVFLPQWRRHAGRATVRSGLGAGQALGQLAFRFRAGPGAGEQGLAQPTSPIAQRQDGRELRHLLFGVQ